MVDPRPYKRNYQIIRTIEGIDPTLWRWVKSRAALENRTIGEIFNLLIDQHRQIVEANNTRLEITFEAGEAEGESHSIRGIDPYLWRWLRARGIIEERRLNEMMNELLHRYRATAGDPVPVVSSWYQNCVICDRLYETVRTDSSACSNRCRVALHRRLRKENP